MKYLTLPFNCFYHLSLVNHHYSIAKFCNIGLCVKCRKIFPFQRQRAEGMISIN